MTNVQKIIKYLSIAFAFYLIISILFGLLSIFKIFDDINPSYEKNDKVYNKQLNLSDCNDINIKLNLTSLYIKKGNSFKLETNNKNVKVKEDNNTLTIRENKNINLNTKFELTLTIPENKIFNEINIDNGVGILSIDKLNGNIIDFNFGAGKVLIKELYANNNVKIDTGAGKVSINNSKLNNLDLDMGVGEFNINSVLIGNNKIDTGIGKLSLKLLDSKDNYTFKINKGIGSIKINNEELNDNATYSNGNNIIKIDGGIGNIKVITE